MLQNNPRPPTPPEWPESWSLPPSDSAFDNLKARHDELARKQLSQGWREPLSKWETGAASDFVEEILRVFLPDHAAPDVAGYGSQRSKALCHNVLVKPEPDGALQCQALIELRDRGGNWIGLDSDGTPIRLKNAVCMHVAGNDDGIQHLALHYSEAALTELLFEAAGNPDLVPAHVRQEIEAGLAMLAGGKPSFPESVRSIDWRKRELSLEAGGKAFSLYVSLDPTGLISMRFFDA